MSGLVKVEFQTFFNYSLVMKKGRFFCVENTS